MTETERMIWACAFVEGLAGEMKNAPNASVAASHAIRAYRRLKQTKTPSDDFLTPVQREVLAVFKETF